MTVVPLTPRDHALPARPQVGFRCSHRADQLWATSARAESLARSTLERYPRDVNMLALLGALLVKLDRDEAEQTLRRVIEAAPTFAKPHEDLGFLLVQAWSRGRGRRRARARDASRPEARERLVHLGKAYAKLGRARTPTSRSSAASTALPSGG